MLRTASRWGLVQAEADSAAAIGPVAPRPGTGGCSGWRKLSRSPACDAFAWLIPPANTQHYCQRAQCNRDEARRQRRAGLREKDARLDQRNTRLASAELSLLIACFAIQVSQAAEWNLLHTSRAVTIRNMHRKVHCSGLHCEVLCSRCPLGTLPQVLTSSGNGTSITELQVFRFKSDNTAPTNDD